MNNEEIRLVKVILESGFASRRKCEKAILSGRVRVNNEIILEPAYKVKEKDTVSLDRKIIERQNKRYMALYKPLGVVSTTKYLPGRRIITEFFKGIKERLFYAGRLDSESRGIMIITNDGEFANIITHPSYEILKVYDVTINGKIDSEKLLEASKGIIAVLKVKTLPMNKKERATITKVLIIPIIIKTITKKIIILIIQTKMTKTKAEKIQNRISTDYWNL